MVTWRLAHRNFRSSSRGQFKPYQEWELLPVYLRRKGHAWCDFLDQKSGSILIALRRLHEAQAKLVVDANEQIKSRIIASLHQALRPISNRRCILKELP